MRYIEPKPMPPEVTLFGGDVNEGVVRIGNTVRRPINSQSEAVHAYLRHLETVGFNEAPRFLGIDERGREVLTYIDGEIAGRPLHTWAGNEDLLVAIARMQRRLHDCSASFKLPAGLEWRAAVQIEGVLPPYDTPNVVGHNDMTPENIIFLDCSPVGLIDFDLAGPTTRVLDVVTTLLHWAPLRDPADRDPVLRDADVGRRMRLFVDGYMLDDSDRQSLLDVAERRFARSWHVMQYLAEHEGRGWARMWEDGVGDVIRRGHEWFVSERPAIAAALLGN